MSLWDDEQDREDEADATRALPVVSPANMLPVQVVDREEIAPGVVSVLIVLPGTRQAPAPYLPGQFVTLALPTSRGILRRSYSLCGAGDGEEPWELTVKRMQMGAVSTYFYQSVGKGTLLYSSLPRGTFTLPMPVGPEMVFVFVAAGSGITPIMGMLRAIARMPEEQRPLAQLHFASKSPDDIIFGDELAELDPGQTWLNQRHYLSSRRERMTAEAILARAGTMGRRAHWYVCGPDVLKHELQDRLARDGVPPARIHSEVFAAQAGPAYRVETRNRSGLGGVLRVADTGAELDVQPDETLLAALERHGYRPDFNCRSGVCGACKLRVVEGRVEPAGEALPASERAAGYVLSCIAQPLGDVTLASGGRPPAGTRRMAAGVGRTGQRAVARTRLVAAVGAGVLLVGSWNLTDHRPLSWGAQAAGASSTPTSIVATQSVATQSVATLPAGTTATPGGSGAPTATTAPGQPTPTTALGQPTATPRPPTPTTVPGQPTATPGQPAPTPTAAAPTPVPTPKPTPTCKSTPSKPC